MSDGIPGPDRIYFFRVVLLFLLQAQIKRFQAVVNRIFLFYRVLNDVIKGFQMILEGTVRQILITGNVDKRTVGIRSA